MQYDYKYTIYYWTGIITVFYLFDKTLRHADKISILNTNKKFYSIEFQFTVDNDNFKILKSGKMKSKHGELICEHESHIFKNQEELLIKSKEGMINDIIGFDFDEFVFLCAMPKEISNEIIDRIERILIKKRFFQSY